MGANITRMFASSAKVHVQMLQKGLSYFTQNMQFLTTKYKSIQCHQ